ncbi:YgaP family membrane protein [Psychromonas sp. PT13]|uniref:YgaP family membrane protein n=1 Tax=Psychromonas sp. PT13 TaxID=3439547 RepID=UPI003EB8D3E9
MTIENGIKVFAGIMVLISVLLTQFVHPGFIWFTVFIGFNLIQSAFTGICPASFLLKILGCKSGDCCK